MNEPALRIGNLSPDDLVDRPVLDRIDPTERAPASAALDAMTMGSIDFFRALGLRLLADPAAVVVAWVHRLDVDGRRLALFELADEPDGVTVIGRHLGASPEDFAVCAIDDQGRVAWVTDHGPLGRGGDAIVGRLFAGQVHAHDVDLLNAALSAARPDATVAVRIRLRDGAAGWRPRDLMLAPLMTSAGVVRLVVLTPPEDRSRAAARVADLEHRLRRIAAELDAAGVMSQIAPSQVDIQPTYTGLTARQWDVLARLARGERVPTIAKDLFVSQSTVRGHVATLLRRFGVHSQAELIEFLRKEAS